MLALASRGLSRRGVRDASGRDESELLAPLLRAADTGRTQADDLLSAFAGRWGGRLEPLVTELSCAAAE